MRFAYTSFTLNFASSFIVFNFCNDITLRITKNAYTRVVFWSYLT